MSTSSCAWLWGGCSDPRGTRRFRSSARTARFRYESAASSTLLSWSGWVVRWSGSWIRACGFSHSGIGRSGSAGSIGASAAVDRDRCRRRARPASPRWRDAGDLTGGSGAGGVGPQDGHRTGGHRPRRVPSPGIHPRRRHGRERAGRSSGPEPPTGSTSRPFTIRVARWPGDVPTMCGRCSSHAWSEPSQRGAWRSFSASWRCTRTKE